LRASAFCSARSRTMAAVIGMRFRLITSSLRKPMNRPAYALSAQAPSACPERVSLAYIIHSGEPTSPAAGERAAPGRLRRYGFSLVPSPADYDLRPLKACRDVSRQNLWPEEEPAWSPLAGFLLPPFNCSIRLSSDCFSASEIETERPRHHRRSRLRCSRAFRQDQGADRERRPAGAP
jgi:hypothetical protein